ncbi:MAG: 16S rRNA (guanine(527)-N(7))-methyltransferase RsmG [Crocinitomicaceae bacterium TMED45]|nr:MAG: 16S rRNA (guanine(527)-N(7))-methyltransferase RsmG [Crocinitomicaceae bacterium TMED45]
MAARDVILPHFPGLTDAQLDQLDAIAQTVWDWNQRINVISRKDPEVMVRHVLHSLGIAKVMRFEPGSRVLDVGTGGGFPGLPLAVLHPETEFVLCDSIGKKIKVVQAAAKAAGLNNVTALHARAEDVEGTYDFVVSRAVTRMAGFLSWLDGKIKTDSLHPLPNGVLYLKGGDLREELSEVEASCQVTPLTTWFVDPFFETKQVVHADLSPA